MRVHRVVTDMLARFGASSNDPGNAGWQRDLSVSYAKLACAYLKAEQRAKAGEALAGGRAIIARLIAQFPDWPQWKRDLCWFDQQIAALKK
jgi:hypothetical protein